MEIKEKDKTIMYMMEKALKEMEKSLKEKDKEMKKEKEKTIMYIKEKEKVLIYTKEMEKALKEKDKDLKVMEKAAMYMKKTDSEMGRKGCRLIIPKAFSHLPNCPYYVGVP